MDKIKKFDEFSKNEKQTGLNEINNIPFDEENSLNEMSSINHKDNSNSPLNPGAFKVDVLNKEGNKEPHFHVISKSEGFNVRIKIKDGELLSVKNYGKRNRKDEFADIVKLAKKWLPLKSPTALNKLTNQEYAYVQFFSMNTDSPYNK